MENPKARQYTFRQKNSVALLLFLKNFYFSEFPGIAKHT